jgi:hypothetical protein
LEDRLAPDIDDGRRSDKEIDIASAPVVGCARPVEPDSRIITKMLADDPKNGFALAGGQPHDTTAPEESLSYQASREGSTPDQVFDVSVTPEALINSTIGVPTPFNPVMSPVATKRGPKETAETK